MIAAHLRRFVREGHARHGLQLVAAVVAAFAASAVLRLPEGAWAVMSALIVTRANADATMAAGWQRVAATIAGSLCGLAGAWLFAGADARAWLALLPVALLAFATADRPGLRSAPIAALIVLSAAGRAGASPVAVAALRTLEIAVGAAAGIGVAWAAHRLSVSARPVAAVAALLRQLAAQVGPAAEASPAPGEREARALAVRATLRRIGEMVQGSRQEGPRALLGLGMRLAQDAGWLARVLEAAPADSRAAAAAAARAVAAALQATAARLEGGASSPAEAIAALSPQASPAWRADAVLLLQDDLRRLLHVSAGGAKRA